ncbi:MAG: DUF3592 domain-containing protein [Cyclobacteriaceae bacterium]|nr:DUF3592 domain-containing protein [Cyclobacteriaceae bacterium]
MKRHFRLLGYLIGFFLICGGLVRIWNTFTAFANLEEAEGVIINFHTHEGDPDIYHPNVSFLYRGDTLLVEGTKDEEGEFTGKRVTVIFPPGKPDEAKIKSVPWFISALLILAGIWCVGLVGFISLLERENVQRQISEKISAPEYESKIPKLVLFGFLAALLIGLTYHFTAEKIKNPGNSTEIGGLILLGFLAFIFTAVVLLNLFSLIIESKLIPVDAEFSKLLGPFRELSASGEVTYYWRIQCKWLHPETNQWITFTSSLISGVELYYPQPFIRVEAHRKMPAKYYTVNLALVSKTPASGITLLDAETMSRWREKEAQWKEAVKRKFQRSLRAKIGRLLNCLLNFLKRNEKAVRGVSIVLVLLGIIHVGRDREDPSENDISDDDNDTDTDV